MNPIFHQFGIKLHQKKHKFHHPISSSSASQSSKSPRQKWNSSSLNQLKTISRFIGFSPTTFLEPTRIQFGAEQRLVISAEVATLFSSNRGKGHGTRPTPNWCTISCPFPPEYRWPIQKFLSERDSAVRRTSFPVRFEAHISELIIVSNSSCVSVFGRRIWRTVMNCRVWTERRRKRDNARTLWMEMGEMFSKCWQENFFQCHYLSFFLFSL